MIDETRRFRSLTRAGGILSEMDGVSPNSQHESELVPAPIIICFIDAHAVGKYANQKRDWSDHAVPKPTPESSRSRPIFFVFGV
jgi:hypothetical protein